MEQARCWMSMKRRHDHVDSSWEEGYLGDYTWPPRSYSCSFCSREFKSAQALGGHMNAHRRDRARLKPSPSPPIHQPLPSLHTDVVNPFLPHQKFTFMYDQTSDSDQAALVTGSPASPFRVLTKKHDYDQNTLVPDFHSRTLHEHDKKKLSSAESFSHLVADGKYFDSSDLRNEEESPKTFDSKCSTSGDQHDKEDLPVNLNLLIFGPQVNASSIYEDSTPQTCKRRRVDEPSFTLLTKSRPELSAYPKMLILSPNSLEDLDLELRLGDPPKAKMN